MDIFHNGSWEDQCLSVNDYQINYFYLKFIFIFFHKKQIKNILTLLKSTNIL